MCIGGGGKMAGKGGHVESCLKQFLTIFSMQFFDIFAVAHFLSATMRAQLVVGENTPPMNTVM